MPMSGKPRCRPYCWSQNKNGPPLFARIGIMRAINRHVERVFDTSRKEKLGEA
jgi:hypothetical protein